jgi:hypothetical protein
MLTRLSLTIAFAAGLAVLATALWAAPFVTLCFEGEDAKLPAPARVFYVMKSPEDASVKVSGNKVLAVPKVDPGQHVAREDVVYRVQVPQDGRYYLWARVFWSNGCGNSFYLKVQGYDSGEWIIGGDSTYNALHWVALTDGDSSEPRPLLLKKGVVNFTLGSKESGARVDQLLLTTDREKRPAGIYKPTKDLLVKDDPKKK